jgi:hypothetical protein
MYILLPDGVNRYGDENMRNSFSPKIVEGGRPDPFQFFRGVKKWIFTDRLITYMHYA